MIPQPLHIMPMNLNVQKTRENMKTYFHAQKHTNVSFNIKTQSYWATKQVLDLSHIGKQVVESIGQIGIKITKSHFHDENAFSSS